MMTSGSVQRTSLQLTAGFLAATLVLGGCSDGNSESSVVSGTSHLTGSSGPGIDGDVTRTLDTGPVEFELLSISVQPGATLELNRDIEFTFNYPVDLSTVSLNTVRIESLGQPATGTFMHKVIDRDGDGEIDVIDRRVLVFTPSCPLREDYLDAGFMAGRPYSIFVLGNSAGPNTVRSLQGVALEENESGYFFTPDPLSSLDVLFVDKQAGPPAPVVRSVGSQRFDATHVEVGHDATNLAYFEFDPDSGDIAPPSGFELPLNLYADSGTQVAFELVFNQALDPAAANFANDRLRLEFQDATGTWRPLETRTELISNCATSHVRLEPIGILPADSSVRAVVLPGFRDIVGQSLLLPTDRFAEARVQAVDFASLSPADELADERLEEFDFGGEDPRSFEDTAADDILQRASWGGGALTGSLGISGGPGGDFDWVVRSGEVFFFDTTLTLIVGGPDGLPVTVQEAVNGFVDVRDLIVEEGGLIRVQGPNPMQISASRNVIVRGEIDLSGFDGKHVATLNTGHQPEVGGAGAASGGRGGNSSENTMSSTPRGGAGSGPYQVPGIGGQGGESQFAPASLGKDARRPGGGGGGRFALDACDPLTDPDCNPLGGPYGLAAEAGFDGHPGGTGAETGEMPARGGSPGASVFVDGDPSNDFFGLGPELDDAGNLVGMIRGELPGLWAGAGGGGGGDAVPSSTFPNEPWNPASDEKGGPGGGAAGGLRVRALDTIVFGANGRIRAEGGRGGTGENTIFLDHIGASGGAGSGGHVVLESATGIDFTDGGLNAGAGATTWISTQGGPRTTGAATSGGLVSFGGAGGPGVIQLNVPKPNLAPGVDPNTTDIVVPISLTTARNPLELVSAPTSQALFTTVGAVSMAQSKWISIGEADRNPSGGQDLVRFLFPGLDADGRIATTDGGVDELDPILTGSLPGGNVVVADPFTLVLSGAALDELRNDTGPLSNDLYLRNPALLVNFKLELAASGASIEDVSVAAASYDDAAVALTLTLQSSLVPYLDALASGGGSGTFALIPRFFRLATGGVVDELPDSAAVYVRFQATGADALGQPSDELLVDWTGDVGQLNSLAPGELQYFRFQVEFDLDVQEQGLTPDLQPVALDFLRVPFRF